MCICSVCMQCVYRQVFVQAKTEPAGWHVHASVASCACFNGFFHTFQAGLLMLVGYADHSGFRAGVKTCHADCIRDYSRTPVHSQAMLLWPSSGQDQMCFTNS